MNTLTETACSSCGTTVPAGAYFCPRCGFNIRVTPINTSTNKQIIIYLVSFFLAPFGLGYTVKYIRQSDPKARMIGVASLVLTIFSIALMLWLGVASINQYNELLRALN